MQICTLLQTDNHTNTPPLFYRHALPAAEPNASKPREKSTRFQPKLHSTARHFHFIIDNYLDLLWLSCSSIVHCDRPTWAWRWRQTLLHIIHTVNWLISLHHIDTHRANILSYTMHHNEVLISAVADEPSDVTVLYTEVNDQCGCVIK